MSARKKVHVAFVLAKANRMLAAPDGPYANPDIRRGVARLLETVLHDAGAYEGYSYLDGAEGDRTRRQYAAHASLRQWFEDRWYARIVEQHADEDMKKGGGGDGSG
jgi:hypothetical protein